MGKRGMAGRIVAAALLVVCLGGDAHADEESDKVREIEGYLGDIKGYLDGIAGDSSYSDIDYALDRASKVKELAERLRSLGPQTDAGKTMANYYPDWVEKFKESARYLKEQKQAQLKQTDGRLWEKCKDAQNKLRDEVRRYVERNDPAGMQKIPELAERAAYDLRDPLKREDEVHREMERWHDYARRFSETHGRWSDVKGELHDGANDIWEAWKRRREETQKECGDLAKGKENPVVVEALKQLAGNDEVRKGLIRAIDVQAKSIYEGIKEVDRRSDDGASQIQEAQRSADEILSLLDKLKYARGEDDQAKRITDYWPDQVKKLREALVALKKLKAGQHVIDAGIEKCTSDERALQEKIRYYVGNKDEHEDGVIEIYQLAKALGETYTAKLRKAEEIRQELERWRDDAKRFDYTEGPWSNVKSSLHAAADGTYAYYRDLHEKVKRACDDLSKGERNPDVERAVEELKKNETGRKENYRAVAADFKAWAVDVRKFRDWSQRDTDDIQKAICEEDEETVEDAAKAVADRWASQLNSEWGSLTGRADRMLAAAEVLIGRKVKSAPRLKERIQAALQSIENVKAYQLQGANNPKLRAQIEVGKKKHQEKQSSLSCEKKELEIESSYCSNPKKKGSSCIMDCVKDCVIIEIKPDNPAGKALGEKQARAYLDGVERKYQAKKERMFDDSGYEVFRKCLDSNQKLKVDWRVEPYPFCPEDDDLQDRPRQEVSAEIPAE